MQITIPKTDTPLKPLQYIGDSAKAAMDAIKEAREIVKAAVEAKEDKSCHVYVDINGEIFKGGDFPDAQFKSYNTPPHSILVYCASVATDNEYDPASQKDAAGHITPYHTWRKIGTSYKFSGYCPEEFEGCTQSIRYMQAKLDRWIKKNREKVHHEYLPITAKVHFSRSAIDANLAVIEKAIETNGEGYKAGYPEALASIDQLMKHFRQLQKEITIQKEHEYKLRSAKLYGK
jgi:hypothetical protein